MHWLKNGVRPVPPTNTTSYVVVSWHFRGGGSTLIGLPHPGRVLPTAHFEAMGIA